MAKKKNRRRKKKASSGATAAPVAGAPEPNVNPRVTPKQRKRYRQSRVTQHLRKGSEGCSPGFTKPRMKHSFLGLPSVTISAAVAKDRIIMWEVVHGSWNGSAAAAMYSWPIAEGASEGSGPGAADSPSLRAGTATAI